MLQFGFSYWRCKVLYVALVGRGRLFGYGKSVLVDDRMPLVTEMALAAFLDPTGFRVNAVAGLLDEPDVGNVRNIVLVTVLETSYSF